MHSMYVALYKVTGYDAWLYIERAEMAAVSSGTSYVRTKQCCNYITWVDIQRAQYSHAFRVTCDKSAVGARERRTALCKSDQHINRGKRFASPAWSLRQIAWS